MNKQAILEQWCLVEVMRSPMSSSGLAPVICDVARSQEEWDSAAPTLCQGQPACFREINIGGQTGFLSLEPKRGKEGGHLRETSVRVCMLESETGIGIPQVTNKVSLGQKSFPDWADCSSYCCYYYLQRSIYVFGCLGLSCGTETPVVAHRLWLSSCTV